jgi:hypothetical protein
MTEGLVGRIQIEEVLPHRLLRPGGPILSIPFGGFVNSFTGLMIENIILYLFLIFIIFKNI